MVDVLAAPQQAKRDESLRTLAAISTAHWVSHFHLFVLPMLFPFLKAQLGVGYIGLGFALTVFAVTSGLTQAPIGYLADHLGARKVLLMGLTLGGFALIMLSAKPPSVRPISRTLRSEEHTSELQSPDHLVCRLLLEKKNIRLLINNTAFSLNSVCAPFR